MAQNSPATQPPTHLIILCCHAIFNPSLPHADPYNADHWHLAPFQKPAEHLTFCQHLLVSLFHLDLLNRASPGSTALVISGGRTRRSEGLRGSEARGYWAVAERLGWLDGRGELVASTESGDGGDVKVVGGLGEKRGVKVMPMLEELATDSYQNLLFSILIFMRQFGNPPEAITVITHAFKEQRFLKYHGPAIQWPQGRLNVIGVNPPQTASQHDFNQRGELENGLSRWEQDLYGSGDVLASKRAQRGWDAEALKEVESLVDDPRVGGLLHWDGGRDGKEIYSEVLPWSEDR
ncbi:hypothetical protein P152DRAFT_513127 [Eremomyces bilateralis CBS 781.70]|uniref:DUF218 domain-containing protein n=1 Tax=Eremomyces bilateralis CBS 781.70 TaxID=1392243 RepID=A0A6G1G6U4_9PEZI|nr:uncharacterized protein P152DRAFT_513127 [Eremomyces bilateralis CBS 781.70]KAF1813742.1 hypothetical protein P152DRAFT_513127 [Eremomyces bilateralis CBS 781.70]